MIYHGFCACGNRAYRLLIRLGQVPAVVCRAESDDADEEEACEHCGFGRTRDDVENVDDRGSDDRGACVDVLYENVGHLERERVS